MLMMRARLIRSNPHCSPFFFRAFSSSPPQHRRGRGQFHYFSTRSNHQVWNLWTLEKTTPPEFLKKLPFDPILHATNETRLTRVGVGALHSMFVVSETTMETLWGMGLNTSGQVGLPLENTVAVVPQPIHTVAPPQRIKHLSCGRSHTCFVVETPVEDLLYVMGHNGYGQLGVTAPTVDTPTRVNFAEPVRIQHLHCGADHTLCITNDKRLHAVGFGSDGQLGIGTLENNKDFDSNCIELDFSIAKISCSVDFTMILTKEGKVFGWGNNEYAQVFQADSEKDKIANIYPLTFDFQVKDIAVGATHGLVLDDKGRIFGWGFGPGLLGDTGTIQRKPMLLSSKQLPPAQKIFCGPYTSFALCDENLFGWGCLGTNSITKPTHLQLVNNNIDNARIENVSSGLHDTLVSSFTAI